MQATVWRHQSYSDGGFELLTDSGKSFTLAYKLEALKSDLIHVFQGILFSGCFQM